MEDSEIIDLYWKRDESAIQETDHKYHRYCFSIADHIIDSHEDAEECVNDTWLNTWNAIPPERPSMFQTWLGWERSAAISPSTSMKRCMHRNGEAVKQRPRRMNWQMY